MPKVVSDIVDVYVFRRLNARVQFLLLQRRSDVAMPHTWQAFHAQIESTELTMAAVSRTVRELAGLNVSAVYSADYVNQFYDESRDVLVLAPVFAVNVNPQAPVSLADDFRDCAWFDRDEATARLPFSGQRWATRHIDEIMGLGEAEAELYRLEYPPATATPGAASISTLSATPAAPVDERGSVEPIEQERMEASEDTGDETESMDDPLAEGATEEADEISADEPDDRISRT